ncbi:MAG: putative baseplate assembly protein [Candidatus Brocadiae bacterium]|nr:putative baseplate assembly protein [Candidatus Brocadiia bacterium]
MRFLLDERTSEEIYYRTLELAQMYCPLWAKDWPKDLSQLAYQKDLRLSMLKLFGKLTESILQEYNKIPEKYRIAFLDLMGTHLLPANPAIVPLSFSLAQGAYQSYIPQGTGVASSVNPEVVFETAQSLTVAKNSLSSLYSINPWQDKYTDHEASWKKGLPFYVFSNDNAEKSMEHAMFLGDRMLLDFIKPVALKLEIKAKGENLVEYFQEWFDGEGKKLKANVFMEKDTLIVDFKEIKPFSKTQIQEEENFWLIVKPSAFKDRIAVPFPGDEKKDSGLPEIHEITANIQVSSLLPMFVIANDVIVDFKKGFFPFGETPKKKDALYISCKEFSKTNSLLSLNVTLEKPLKHINPDSPFLVAEDIVRPDLLLSKLLSNFDMVGRYVQEKFKKEEMQKLQEEANKENIIAFLLSSLNSLIQEPSFYDPGRFFKTTLRRSTQELLKKNPKEAELLKLNRMLLEDSYNEDIIKQKNVSLVWEYWDGETWKYLGKKEWEDTTKAFTRNGKISFLCPSMAFTEINGLYGQWIRAFIQEDSYGELGGFVKTKDLYEILKDSPETIDKLLKEGITSGYQYQPPAFTPPFVQSLLVDYSFQAKKWEKITKYNNFEYENVSASEKGFQPYKAWNIPDPALFLGFSETIADLPLTLYFAMNEIYQAEQEKVLFREGNLLRESKVDNVDWQYFNGLEWKDLQVEEGNILSGGGGITQFYGPPDIQKKTLFGKKLYWIKISCKSNRKDNWVLCPWVKGIFFNTVWAYHYLTIKKELLGSGNGAASLTLTFLNKPVLPGQTIIVRENELPTSEERKIIEEEEGKNAIQVLEVSGKKEIWVQWHEVQDFVESRPLSRHYVLNRIQGTVLFGNGERGMIPPKGSQNIVAKEYKSGGGEKGNQDTGTITTLTSAIPNIKGVENPVPSVGGTDQEDFNRAAQRGPGAVKNLDRAVTKEDFEWLALQFQEVAKAKCIETQRGKISLVVVPKTPRELKPKKVLLDLIKRYLEKRSLITLKGKIEVEGPDYTEVNADITVKILSMGESSRISEAIQKKIHEFLHPVKGGYNNQGWDFGEKIYVVDIGSSISKIEGIDYIQKIVLKKMESSFVKEEASGDKKGFISLDKKALPYCGKVTVITTN